MASKKTKINLCKKNQKYLIACDLDGTLLNSKSQLSNETIKGMKKVIAKGHYVCLLTGRPYDGSIEFFEQLGLDTIMVNQNGCFISKPRDKSFVPIGIGWSKEILRQILSNKVLQKIMTNILIEGMKEAWLWDESKDRDVAMKIREQFHLDGRNVAHINRDFKKVTTDITTLVCVIESIEDLNKIIYEIKNISPNLVVRNWSLPQSKKGNMIIEINSKFASKATSVQYLCSYYGIPIERCVAFGDGDNDVEMLANTTWSFALKNATPAARLAARFMTKYNNDDHGVVKQLLKFLDIK